MSQKNEELNKSIDFLIDEIFSEDVEKSIDIVKDSKTKADEVVNKAPKAQKDEARGAGRPKQISDVPQNDQDGARAKDYDSSIKERDGVEDENSEVNQVKEKNQIKKSMEEDSEYAEFLAFKKSKEEAKAEELKKAKLNEQSDLIKSVVESTVAKVSAQYNDEITSLKKSLNEQSEILKSYGSKPVAPKSITNVNIIEKSMDPNLNSNTPQEFSKSEIQDAADELVKSGELTMEHAIELDNNGYIYDKRAKAALEAHLNKK